MSNNEPAFPLNELNQTTDDLAAQHFGLTIRDYFAAMAMQGMVGEWHGQDKRSALRASLIAQYAYEFADVMLKARQT